MTKLKVPATLLDYEGYPTDEYIAFIENFTYETMPVIDFVTNVLQEGWHFADWGFKLKRKYAGIRKLELHTGGWSGNEEIIHAIIKNRWLTQYKLRYVKWVTGGHYYFEIHE